MQTISATSRWDLARYFPGAPQRLLQRAAFSVVKVRKSFSPQALRG